MSLYALLPFLLFLSIPASFLLGRGKARREIALHGSELHSRPGHYGILTMIVCSVPASVLYALWRISEGRLLTAIVTHRLPAEITSLPADKVAFFINEFRNVAEGNFAVPPNALLQQAVTEYLSLQALFRTGVTLFLLFLLVVTLFLACRSITPSLRARSIIERLGIIFLFACSAIAILTTAGIVLSVLVEAIRFFHIISITDFLFGLDWSPQIAIHPEQQGASGAFGIIPLFAGTFLITVIAMVVAVPIGLLSAIYLSEYAAAQIRTLVKPALEILAGIPTVVYGFFTVLVFAPLLKEIGVSLGISVAAESALAAGFVMGMMIIPYISSLSDDIIHSVPYSLREGSYALGATQFETIRTVVIPAAMPGILGGILLAISRAIGETMIVVMAAGLSARLTANPFQSVTTVTAQIVTLLVGEQEFDSPKTLAAFALGLLLLCCTFVLNFIALRAVRRYRKGSGALCR